jgi:hypothetical protein
MRVRMAGPAGVIAIAALQVGAAPASAAAGDASREDKSGGAHSRASTAEIRVGLLSKATGKNSADLVEADPLRPGFPRSPADHPVSPRRGQR